MKFLQKLSLVLIDSWLPLLLIGLACDLYLAFGWIWNFDISAELTRQLIYTTGVLVAWGAVNLGLGNLIAFGLNKAVLRYDA